MRFNPKADIGGGRVDDAGGYAGSGSRLPIPTTAGGGRVGIVLLLLGLLFRFLQSRRAAR